MSADITQKIAESFSRQPFMNHLGATVEAADTGSVSIGLELRPELTQQHGFAHGGVIASLADTAASYCAMTTMREEGSLLTIEFKVNFMKPGKGQKLRADGRTISAGRTITTTECSVFAIDDGTETLIAKMQATIMCLPGRPDNSAVRSG